jgi:predicted transcriptional regulator YdeE
MKITETKKDSIKVIGIEVQIDRPDQAMVILGDAWKKFVEENIIKKIPYKLNKDDLIAVYTNYTFNKSSKPVILSEPLSEIPYVTIIGTIVRSLDEIPKDLTGLEIPPQKYIVFKNKGILPFVVQETWEKIWNTKLNRTFTFDLELYKDGIGPHGEVDLEIYIAVS